jgi:hypothetical protein
MNKRIRFTAAEFLEVAEKIDTAGYNELFMCQELAWHRDGYESRGSNSRFTSNRLIESHGILNDGYLDSELEDKSRMERNQVRVLFLCMLAAQRSYKKPK